VREILVVYHTTLRKKANWWSRIFYHTIPDCQDLDDISFCILVLPGLKMVRGMSALKIHYWAGYRAGEVPADLASACLELAAWNMSRYQV
jgi:hypothetical protein